MNRGRIAKAQKAAPNIPKSLTLMFDRTENKIFDSL